MKKTFLYSLAVLASVSLASCNGDYDDWAQPQHNPQEASAAKYGITFAAGTEAESSLPDDDGIINLVTVNSDRKSTRLNSSHGKLSRMPSSA